MGNSERYLRKYCYSGFTLLELMIVLVIATILITIGVPSFQIYMANQQIKTTSFDLFSTFVFARSEAVKRGVSVSICKSSTGSGCGDDSVGWKDGWVIFVDNNANGICDSCSPDIGTGDQIISVHGPIQPNVAIVDPTAAITYRKDGRISVTGGVVIKINSFVTGVQVRCVNIDISGRPNSDKPNSDGVCKA